MQLNEIKFKQNGRSGYVLKPEAYRNPSVPHNPISKQFLVKVIST